MHGRNLKFNIDFPQLQTDPRKARTGLKMYPIQKNSPGLVLGVRQKSVDYNELATQSSEIHQMWISPGRRQPLGIRDKQRGRRTIMDIYSKLPPLDFIPTPRQDIYRKNPLIKF